ELGTGSSATGGKLAGSSSMKSSTLSGAATLSGAVSVCVLTGFGGGDVSGISQSPALSSSTTSPDGGGGGGSGKPRGPAAPGCTFKRPGDSATISVAPAGRGGPPMPINVEDLAGRGGDGVGFNIIGFGVIGFGATGAILRVGVSDGVGMGGVGVGMGRVAESSGCVPVGTGGVGVSGTCCASSCDASTSIAAWHCRQ